MPAWPYTSLSGRPVVWVCGLLRAVQKFLEFLLCPESLPSTSFRVESIISSVWKFLRQEIVASFCRWVLTKPTLFAQLYSTNADFLRFSAQLCARGHRLCSSTLASSIYKAPPLLATAVLDGTSFSNGSAELRCGTLTDGSPLFEWRLSANTSYWCLFLTLLRTYTDYESRGATIKTWISFDSRKCYLVCA